MALFFFPLTSRCLILGQHILKREKEKSGAGVLSNSVLSLAGRTEACTVLWADSVSALAVVGEKSIFVERISGVCIVGVFFELVSGAILSYSNKAYK